MTLCSIPGNENQWVDLLPPSEFAYNSSIRSSSKACPFELTYGFSPARPLVGMESLPKSPQLFSPACRGSPKESPRRATKSKLNQKLSADQKRRPSTTKVGAKMCLKASHLSSTTIPSLKAVSPRYRGPFMVVGKIEETA